MNHLWEQPFQIIDNCPYPVFRQDLPDISLFYAPGYLAVVQSRFTEELEYQLVNQSPKWEAALYLQDYARSAVQCWDRQFDEKHFVPLCLTLYTSQRCNLNCSYCFSHDEKTIQEADLELDFILEAAEEVIGNCKKAGVPFTLVVHGGGEPTLDSRLPLILKELEKVVARHDLACFRYLGTNGVMPEETARWAVNHFNEIGLSCDGPTEIQAVQRPLKNGQNSMEMVERTASIIHESGKLLQIRATISPQTVEQMPEIAAYLFETLKADEVRVEPVFLGGRIQPENKVPVEMAEKFCTAFLQARQISIRHKKRWLTTGSRPGEIHGRYCQVYRNVLQLIPGNGISACFKMGGCQQAQSMGMEIRDHKKKGLSFNEDRILQLQHLLAFDDPACQTCFNRYHCARGCPDACPASTNGSAGELRCRINKMLTTALLQELSEQLRPLLRDHPSAGCAVQGGL